MRSTTTSSASCPAWVALRTPTKRSRTCWWWRIGKNLNKNSKGFKNPQLSFNTEFQLCF
jgi:hypothetical protein